MDDVPLHPLPIRRSASSPSLPASSASGSTADSSSLQPAARRRDRGRRGSDLGDEVDVVPNWVHGEAPARRPEIVPRRQRFADCLRGGADRAAGRQGDGPPHRVRVASLRKAWASRTVRGRHLRQRHRRPFRRDDPSAGPDGSRQAAGDADAIGAFRSSIRDYDVFALPHERIASPSASPRWRPRTRAACRSMSQLCGIAEWMGPRRPLPEGRAIATPTRSPASSPRSSKARYRPSRSIGRRVVVRWSIASSTSTPSCPDRVVADAGRRSAPVGARPGGRRLSDGDARREADPRPDPRGGRARRPESIDRFPYPTPRPPTDRRPMIPGREPRRA